MGGDFNLDIITDTLGQLIGDTPTPLPNLSDLFQGNSSLGNIDLSNTAPGLTGSLPEILSTSTQPNYDATSLPTSTPGLEFDQLVVFG